MLKRRLVSNGLSVHQAESILATAPTYPAGALTAAGTNYATAFVPDMYSNMTFTTVASATGTRLPFMEAGDEVAVNNYGANALLVYPEATDQIAAGAAGAAVSVAVGKTAIFKRIGATRLSVNISA